MAGVAGNSLEDNSRRVVWSAAVILVSAACLAYIWGSPVRDQFAKSLDVAAIVEKLEAQYKGQLASSQEQINALTNAVTALVQQYSQPHAPPGIAEALTQLQQGNTEAAETIFETVLARKAAEGQAAHQQAAEAARHLGALAFLHDTQKALTAYRRAVALDPANAEGWNQLGHLLVRIGLLDDAADAYRKVLTLGEKASDRHLLAIAYGNLGNVYWMRGDLTQAEAMYRKALELDEALSRKEGMASDYGGLGNVYRMRGDLTQAEAMYHQALTLLQEIGATPDIEKVRALLDTLDMQSSP